MVKSRFPFLLASLLGILAARPALASCQTYFCYVQYCRQDVELAEEVRRQLAQPGLDLAVREKLLGRPPSSLVGCQYRVAAYDSRFRWERQPVLEIPADELEARARAEERRWLERLLADGAGEPGRLWSRLAETQATPEKRLAILRGAFELHAADPEVAAGLGHELIAQKRFAEAEAHLRSFLVDHPEAAVYSMLEYSLATRGAGGELRALHEERARRRPEDVDSQVALLRYYAERGLLAEHGALLASLETRFPRAVDRFHLCDAVTGATFQPATLACMERLLAAGAPPSPTDDDLTYLESARRRLLFDGIHRKSWPRIEQVLQDWPQEDLLDPWSDLLNWLRQETCPRFLAAYRTGRYFSVAPAAEGSSPVTEMAMMLSACGETAEAERLLVTVLPSFHPGFMPALSPAQRVAEIRRRLEREPHDPVLHRALADASRELPAEERTAILERWAEQVPGEAEPALRLAAFEEQQGRGAAALRWWEEGVRRSPRDYDLLVRLGAVALRAQNHAAARSAALRLLAAPDASPRQVAEGRYLLGRVAQREGRSAEASDQLMAYFLARLRYAGCFGTPEGEGGLTCDEPLLAHLLREADVQRLARYLDARAEAVAYYERYIEVVVQRDRGQWTSSAARLLAGPCAEASRGLRPSSPGSEVDPTALAAARSHCPASLSDGELAFPDDDLLGLTAKLTHVG